MLNSATRVWAAAGLAENLHLEHFAVSRAAPRGQGGTVTFGRAGKSVAVDAATSLMDAGERVGVQMPFGCRMGICQTCVVSLLDGNVRDLRTGAEHEAAGKFTPGDVALRDGLTSCRFSGVLNEPERRFARSQ